MCGRCACALDPQDIRRACSYKSSKSSSSSSTVVEPYWITVTKGQEYYPSYNISPQTNTPVLLSGEHEHVRRLCGEESERVIQVMKWGLVPQWHRGVPKSFPTLLNNCRYEGMFDKPSFRGAISKRQRCVVLCQGFYEWKRDKKTKGKQPYFVHFKEDASFLDRFKPDKEEEAIAAAATASPVPNRLLTLAGLYDIWTPQTPSHSEEESSGLYTYTVITVDATQSFTNIHDRLPAVLEDDSAISTWLDVTIPTLQAVKCINSSGSESLNWYPVSNLVNNVRNKSSDCITKVDTEVKKKGTLHNWFKTASSSSSSDDCLQSLPKRSKMEC